MLLPLFEGTNHLAPRPVSTGSSPRRSDPEKGHHA